MDIDSMRSPESTGRERHGAHVQERLASFHRRVRVLGPHRCRAGPRTPCSVRIRLPPPTLVGRDPELGRLAGMFVGLGGEGGQGRAVITGPVGSGKTAIARRFCQDVESHLDGTRLTSVHCTSTAGRNRRPRGSCNASSSIWIHVIPIEVSVERRSSQASEGCCERNART